MIGHRGVKKGPQLGRLPLYSALSKAAIWDALCEVVALSYSQGSNTGADRVLADPVILEAALREALGPVLRVRGDRMPR